MAMGTQVNRRVREEELERLLPVVAQFYAHFGFAWDAGKKRELLEGFLQRTEAGQLWLAEVDGAVVGYALVPFYFALEFDGPVALLDEFFVVAEMRGQGVGAKLLREVMAGLRSEGITRIRLEVDARHPEAAELYERLGFSKDGRETWSKGSIVCVGNSPLTQPPAVGIVRPLFWGLFPEGRGSAEDNKQSNF